MSRPYWPWGRSCCIFRKTIPTRSQHDRPLSPSHGRVALRPPPRHRVRHTGARGRPDPPERPSLDWRLYSTVGRGARRAGRPVAGRRCDAGDPKASDRQHPGDRRGGTSRHPGFNRQPHAFHPGGCTPPGRPPPRRLYSRLSGGPDPRCPGPAPRGKLDHRGRLGRLRGLAGGKHRNGDHVGSAGHPIQPRPNPHRLPHPRHPGSGAAVGPERVARQRCCTRRGRSVVVFPARSGPRMCRWGSDRSRGWGGAPAAPLRDTGQVV